MDNLDLVVRTHELAIKAKYWDKLVDFCKNNKLDTDYVSVFEWANSVAEIIEDGIDKLQMEEEKDSNKDN